MKKLLLGLTLSIATMFSAQYNSNNGWGNNGYGSYQNNDDYYFDDDYYYEYPNDYYADSYYQDFYNDYRTSITMVNWNSFFLEFGLSRNQVSLIIDLNRQFDSYNVWNSYYRMNPVRWYYDRFYALQQILGPRIFLVFQNRYYDGYAPITYYHNRCRDWYRPRYTVMPRYRNVNVNIYHVNRNDYHRSVGNKYGWNQPRNPHSNNGFRNENGRRDSQSRNDVNHNNGNRQNQNNGVRSGNNGNRSNSNVRMTNESTRNQSSGMRNSSQRSYETPRASTQNNNNSSMRNQSQGSRGQNASYRTEGNRSQRSASAERPSQNNSQRSSDSKGNSGSRGNSNGSRSR